MNKPAGKIAGTVSADSNLALWDELAKTDPKHTKGFKRGGGFSGTAVKPIWITKRLTEIFGPCGQGWGIGQPSFETVHAGDEILVYCTVACWHSDPAKVLYGVGGDKVVTKRNDGKSFYDDEAFKKAFTDAVGNAFKFIGVAADVHMGLFDDNKYVQAMNEEFAAREREDDPPQKVPGITKIKERLSGLLTDGNAATDLEAFNALIRAHKDDLKTIRDANHEWWTGDGADFEGFRDWKERRKSELTPADDTLAYQLLTSALSVCDSHQELQGFLKKHGDTIGLLDGEESRKFETLYDAKAAALKMVAQASV
jgi:hypothetical protein